MTIALTPGQNATLPQRVLRFVASSDSAMDMSALVVGDNLTAMSSDEFVFYNQPETSGVRLASDGVHINLDDVRADASGVLCIVSADPATPTGPLGQLAGTLFDSAGSALAEFPIPLAGNETAVICLELYRRGLEWKVRAVGQGYAGGLAQLITVHGVDVDDQPPPATTRPAVSDPALSVPIAPLDHASALERVWMIFEDAARSTAAVVSARNYAGIRLDDELSSAVADPATRNSPAAVEARAQAQLRHDELVATAETSYQNDAVVLITELDGVDSQLPRSLASWESPAWLSTTNGVASDGIRIGVVSAPERGLLRVPFCVPVPLQRPLWIDTEAASAAAPVVTALVLRLLAASPAPILDVIDLTGSLQMLTGPLARVMKDPVVSDHQNITTKLNSLVEAVDLAELAASSGFADTPSPARVLVLSDFGHGLQTDDLTRVALLASRGAAARLSVIIIGATESTSSDPLLSGLSQHCQHIPANTLGTQILDPWTRSEWDFIPDSVPTEADRLAQLMNSVWST